jgi:hypothetical protein
MEKTICITEAMLQTILEYIEDMEESADWEWGSCRKVNELIELNEMPDIYYKLVELKNKQAND